MFSADQHFGDFKQKMEELIKTFHIETGLILAQLVNFLIVLLVLYKFAYKPALKMLNDRAAKIEKGLKDAEQSGKKLSEITQKEKEVLLEAKKEAREIIRKSEEDAQKNSEMILEEARKKTDNILQEAKKIIEQEKNKMVAEAKREVAGLVVAATGKILNEKIDAGKDKELIESSLR